MGIVRALGRLFKWGVAAFALVAVAMLGWTFTWPEVDVRGLQRADAIICLGGGMDGRGTLADATLTRVERCVQLYEAGLAPFVVFSGGIAREVGPSAGGQMGRYALGLGLPDTAIVVEGRAQSTLQNALYSLDLASDADKFILVTEAFHLPRSWASFKWAAWYLGAPADKFALVMSEPVRTHPVSGDVNWRILARESLAIWFNAARAVAFTVAPNRSEDWLH